MQPKRCALPGCDELIEAADGQKARKFCCAAHRVISRQQRREIDEKTAYEEAMKALKTGEPKAGEPSESTSEPSAAPEQPAPDAATVEIAAPARRRPRPSRPTERTEVAPVEAPTEPKPTESLLTEDHDDEYRPFFVDLDELEDDEPSDGWDAVGNRRQGKTPLAAPTRPQRRSSAGSDRTARTPIQKIPPLYEAEQRARRRRRNQAVALIGAAGILVGGGGWVVTAKANASGDPRAAVGAPVQPETTGTEQWAKQAKISLTTVTRQIDELVKVKEAWKKTPAGQQPGAQPAAIDAVDDRIAALQQQSATLQSWLETQSSVPEVTTQLNNYNAQLANIDRAMATPTSGAETPQQAQLKADRDHVVAQRDAKVSELNSLKNSVQQAMSYGLPDPKSEQETKELGSVVETLIANPDQQEPMPDQAGREPVPGVASRSEDSETASGVTTGAPRKPGRDNQGLGDIASDVVGALGGDEGDGGEGAGDGGGEVVTEEVPADQGAPRVRTVSQDTTGDQGGAVVGDTGGDVVETEDAGHGGGSTETVTTDEGGGASTDETAADPTTDAANAAIDAANDAGKSAQSASESAQAAADAANATADAQEKETAAPERPPTPREMNLSNLTPEGQIRYQALSERRAIKDDLAKAKRVKARDKNYNALYDKLTKNGKEKLSASDKAKLQQQESKRMEAYRLDRLKTNRARDAKDSNPMTVANLNNPPPKKPKAGGGGGGAPTATAPIGAPAGLNKRGRAEFKELTQRRAQLDKTRTAKRVQERERDKKALVIKLTKNDASKAQIKTALAVQEAKRKAKVAENRTKLVAARARIDAKPVTAKRLNAGKPPVPPKQAKAPAKPKTKKT